MTFIEITTVGGEKLLGEFEKVKTGQRYLTAVFAGQKVFNAWKVVSDTHSVTGEPCVMRTRQMVSGQQILSAQVVEPTRADHRYYPSNFRPKVFPKQSGNGIHIFGGGAPDGAQTGVEYPVHREEETLRRYVFLQYPDVKFYLDEEGDPGDADDDWLENERW